MAQEKKERLGLKRARNRIYIPLPDFHFHNHPTVAYRYKERLKDDDSVATGAVYLGRKKETTRFLSALKYSRGERGSFLISGYRGAGKTSFVHQALTEYEANIRALYMFDPQDQGLSKPANWVFGKVSGLKEAIKQGLAFFGFIGSVTRVSMNLGTDEQLQSKIILSDLVRLTQQQLEYDWSVWVRRYWVRMGALVLGAVPLWLLFGPERVSAMCSSGDHQSKVADCLGVYLNLDWVIMPVSGFQWMVAGAYVFLLFSMAFYKGRRATLYEDLCALRREIEYSSETEGLVKTGNIKASQKLKKGPLTAREIETRFMSIIAQASRPGWARDKWFRWIVKVVGNRKDQGKIPAKEDSKGENLIHAAEDTVKTEQTNGLINLFFIFDELDKVGTELTSSDSDDLFDDGPHKDIYRRKAKVDNLLGALKNLITASHARFVFIAGREVLDAYHGEHGSTSPLYDSLFTDTIYLPSLLTDDSDDRGYQLASMTEQYVARQLAGDDLLRLPAEPPPQPQPPQPIRSLEDLAKYYIHCIEDLDSQIDNADKLAYKTQVQDAILTLRDLVHYLTFRSWGNIKRLHSLFEGFVVPADSIPVKSLIVQKAPSFMVWSSLPTSVQGAVKHYLCFDLAAHQRIVMASNVYILLHHQLSDRLVQSDDKLAVSAFFLVNHILKFHETGFSRWDLERVSEALDVHASPELAHLVDVLLGRALRPYIRLVRNSLHRYRFLANYEQEIRYISQISDIESSAYNFSLDSEYKVKRHYQKLLKSMVPEQSGSPVGEHDVIAVADTYIVLGKLHYWEQSYDDALRYFGAADELLDKEFCKYGEGKPLHPVAIILHAKSVLFQGLVEEKRRNFARAAALYQGLQKRTGLEALEQLNYETPRTIEKKPDREGSTSAVNWLDPLRQAGDSKLDILGLSVWAQRYLHLKRGSNAWRDAIAHLYDQFEQQEDKPGACVDYLRLGTLQMFMNEFRVARKSFVMVLQRNQFLFDLRERDAYLGGQACLRLSMASVMGYWKQTQKKLWLEFNTGEEALPSAKVATDAMMEALRPVMMKAELASSDTHQMAFDRTHHFIRCENDEDRYEGHRLKPDFVTKFTEPGYFKMRLDESLALLDAAGEAFGTSSLHVEAAQAYTGGLFLIGAQFELLPWRFLEPKQREEINSCSKQTWKMVDHFARKAARYLSIAHQQAFSHFLNTLTDGDLNDIDVHLGVDPIRQLLEVINVDGQEQGEQLEKLVQPLSTPYYWHHSPAGQTLLVTILWLYRQRFHVINEVGTLGTIHQGLLPNIGIRAQPLAEWLAAQNERMKLKPKIEALTKDPKHWCDSAFQEHLVASIEHFYRVYTVLRRSTNNNQDLSFPPIALVFYSTWELLADLLMAVKEHFSSEATIRQMGVDCGVFVNVGETRCIDSSDGDPHALGKAVSLLRRCLLSVTKKSNEEISSFFLDYSTMRTRTWDALVMMETLGDTNAQSRKDVLNTKHFLDDDYEDITFQQDWMFYQCFGAGALAHRSVMEEVQKELREAYGVREATGDEHNCDVIEGEPWQPWAPGRKWP